MILKVLSLLYLLFMFYACFRIENTRDGRNGLIFISSGSLLMFLTGFYW